MKVCFVDGCNSIVLARGWCCKHYNRWRKHGNTSTVLKPLSPRGSCPAWIKEHVTYNGKECLIWPFARCKDGRAKMSKKVPARVMCTMAHGDPPTLRHEAAHSCGNGHLGCINPSHLRWATSAENHADKHLHGTMLCGEKHYAAKLTAQQVRAIRKLHWKFSLSQIANKFGVSVGAIDCIFRGRTWKHIR